MQPKSSDKLFFMHIGKTAGSYVNQCLVEAYGADNVLAFCNDYIDVEYGTKSTLAFCSRTVISGHLYLADWTEFSRREGIEAKLATIVRSPLHAVVSALRFLDGFNDPSRLGELHIMHPEFREIVLAIGRVDFTDAGSIDAFLMNLTPLGVRIFDNQQSRFFVCKERGDMAGWRPGMSDPLSLDVAPKIEEALGRFDVVGLSERLPETLAMLSDLAGRTIPAIASRVNVSESPRKIDLDNEWIRRALGKRVLVDEWLYRRVAENFAQKNGPASVMRETRAG